MSFECMITGCDLIDQMDQSVIHGDLHANRDRTVFIFNATGNQWMPLEEDRIETRTVFCTEYFERNSVIVMEAKHITPNKLAADYIDEVLP